MIEDNLGSQVQAINTFLNNNNNTYEIKKLEEAGISIEEFKLYADLCLGIKIRDCIIENGGCEFTAEVVK